MSRLKISIILFLSVFTFARLSFSEQEVLPKNWDIFLKQISTPDIQEEEILSDVKKGDFIYQIYKVGGPSKKTTTGRGMCGAGYEVNIIWLKRDLSGEIVDINSILVISCLHVSDVTSEIKRGNDGIYFTYNGFTDEVYYEFNVVYDEKNQPEKGLQVHGQKIQ